MADDDETLISLFTRKKKAKPFAPTEEKTSKLESSKTSLNWEWAKKHWGYFASLVGLVLVVYLNTFDNGLTSDDKGLLLDKNNLTTFKYIFADPLSFIWSLVHAPFYALFGINPSVLRSLNILMHLGNVFLVFMILTKLANYRLGFITASLFAVHPVLTEGVTWISGGPYSWYSFFFLLSFLLYIKSASSRGPTSTYWLSLTVFLVGLLTSNRVLQLFPIFYVYEFVFGSLRKNWSRLIPYTVVSLFWGLIYFIQIGGRQESLQSQFYLEKGTDNPLIQIPFAIVNYLMLIFYPDRYTFYHSDLTITPTQLALFWVGFLVFLGIWAHTFWKNRFLFFWLSFFVSSLLITLTPFRIAWIVAERYVYLGTIGLLVVVAYFLEKGWRRKGYIKIITVITFITIILGLGIRAIVRNSDWQDEKTLWTSTVKSTPKSPKAHNNLGVIYTSEGKEFFGKKQSKEGLEKLGLAERELVQAIALKANYGDAYQNLGEVYYLAKQLDKAQPLFEQALKINPNLYLSYEFLASIAFEKGETEKALEYLSQALKINKTDPDIYVNLAVIYRKLGQVEKAKEALLLALKLEPSNRQAQSMWRELQTGSSVP